MAAARHTVSARGLTWSAPATIDSTRGQPHDLSCVHGGWCMAVDKSGQAIIRARSGWQAPQYITDDDTPLSLAAVSCVSSSFCVAVPGLYEYDGSRWRSQLTDFPLPRGLVDVSCVSTTDCVAVTSDGYSLRRTASGWHPPKQIAPEASKLRVSALSCATTHFCVAGLYSLRTSHSYVAEFHGTEWRKPTRMTDPERLDSISCTSPRFCLAAGELGILRFDGHSWVLDARRNAESISCRPGGFCAD
jgi:hypothetical protein